MGTGIVKRGCGKCDVRRGLWGNGCGQETDGQVIYGEGEEGTVGKGM